MPTPVIVKDGHGSGGKLRINGKGEVVVAQLAYPAKLDSDETRVFRQYLTDDGLSTGSNDARVDGSVNFQDFSILADQKDDIYINTVSFLISDAGASLSQFGNIGALTNGVDVFYEDLSGLATIADELKTNFDFIRLCAGIPSFGDGNTSFRANNVVGASEAYLPVLDIASMFGIPFGLRLRAGTTQRFCIRINDDLTGVDAFNVICYGFKRLNGN